VVLAVGVKVVDVASRRGLGIAITREDHAAGRGQPSIPSSKKDMSGRDGHAGMHDGLVFSVERVVGPLSDAVELAEIGHFRRLTDDATQFAKGMELEARLGYVGVEELIRCNVVAELLKEGLGRLVVVALLKVDGGREPILRYRLQGLAV